MNFGAVPIGEIEFDVFNRHELIPILMALQHLYVNCKPLLEEMLDLIKDDNCQATQAQAGLQGDGLLGSAGACRPAAGANLDYDQLSDLANSHSKVREMLVMARWTPSVTPKHDP